MTTVYTADRSPPAPPGIRTYTDPSVLGFDDVDITLNRYARGSTSLKALL